MKIIEYKKIALSEIDTENRSNEVTIARESARLEEAIKVSGLICPPLLAGRKEKNGYRIISGFKRIDALAALGMTELWAGFSGELSPFEELMLDIRENLSARPFNYIETAAALRKISDIRGVGETVDNYMKLFGLQKSELIFRKYVSINGLVSGFKTEAMSVKVNFNAAVLIAKFEEKAQEKFYSMINSCKMGSNIISEMASNIFEISMERSASAGDIFDSPLFNETLANADISSNEKTDILRRRVLELKRPEFEARNKLFDEKLKAIGLKDISVNPFPYFEKDEVSISFTVKKRSGLAESVKMLKKLENSEFLMEFVG